MTETIRVVHPMSIVVDPDYVVKAFIEQANELGLAGKRITSIERVTITDQPAVGFQVEYEDVSSATT